MEIAADVAPNIPEDLHHLRLLAGQDSRLFQISSWREVGFFPIKRNNLIFLGAGGVSVLSIVASLTGPTLATLSFTNDLISSTPSAKHQSSFHLGSRTVASLKASFHSYLCSRLLIDVISVEINLDLEVVENSSNSAFRPRIQGITKLAVTLFWL